MPHLLLIQPRMRPGTNASFASPPLGLAYVAAYTPRHWDVSIQDENLGELDLSRTPDLAGITTYTRCINHVYSICRTFRSRNIPVVLGGIHASMVPEEAMEQADAVVVGEGESVWPTVIADFENARLQRRYDAPLVSLENLPIPRRDLLSSRYALDAIQTARGCPYACEFCCVRTGGYRTRAAETVVEEFGLLRKKLVFIVDDNFVGTSPVHIARALDICTGLRKRRIRRWWGTQVSLNFADHEELLTAAARSGCKAVFIGFESLDALNLRQMGKGQNLGRGIDGMIGAVERIHRHGIGVAGSFILGGDYDTCGTFRTILDFARKAKLDALEVQLQTVYPGTRLLERLKNEDRMRSRVFPEDWEHCDDVVTYRPKNLTPSELLRGYDYVVRRSHSTGGILAQFLKTWRNTRSLSSAHLFLKWNLGSARDYFGEIRKPLISR